MRRGLADRRVFRGQLGRVRQRLIHIGVYAVDERARPIHELTAEVAVEDRRLVELPLQVGVCIGRDLPLRGVHRAIARGAAQEG